MLGFSTGLPLNHLLVSSFLLIIPSKRLDLNNSSNKLKLNLLHNETTDNCKN